MAGFEVITEACGRWAGSGTAKGVDHVWSGGTGNQSESLFPACSRYVLGLGAQETADYRPCSHCSGFLNHVLIGNETIHNSCHQLGTEGTVGTRR
jgi:hypothetical protein